MTASQILEKYISFFESKNHVRIPNSSLVPLNDPTTLFTSSGMQPLIPYLLGEAHPAGKRLVDVQNCFRAQDIDEIGDNRHTTFFRMLGNWSLGDYFKEEQIPWFWEFLTVQLKLDPKKLYVTAFEGFEEIEKDNTSYEIWKNIFEKEGLNPQERIFFYDAKKNWWSRSGIPENMPIGEPGGPDTEVFYEFDKVQHNPKFGDKCHPNCDCGRFMEIGNSVFMQYKKTENGFEELPQKNVDFGGGLERLIAATEDQNDIFQTSLFAPIIESVEKASDKKYAEYKKEMRIAADHLASSSFIIANGVVPSNKEQGYVLRRLLRRSFDNLKESNIESVIEAIASQYGAELTENFEKIKNTILEEQKSYGDTKKRATEFIKKKYSGDELMGTSEISADDAFLLYSTHGLSPTQIKSLGYNFDEQKFANLMEEHQKLSRAGAAQKFAGGLADHSEMTIHGHTATHLLHQAIRDLLGTQVHQSGSNITSERLRFDFNFDRALTEDEIKKLEEVVNEKIKENLPVHFEMMPVGKAKEIGAIGLFDEKYEKEVKVYFMGEYSKEFCGGPHVDFTGTLNWFKIIKQENIGKGLRRIYAKTG